MGLGRSARRPAGGNTAGHEEVCAVLSLEQLQQGWHIPQTNVGLGGIETRNERVSGKRVTRKPIPPLVQAQEREENQ